MTNDHVELIRSAYEAYAAGNIETVLQLFDPDMEWTFLDPSLPDPYPQVCHGRQEVESALRRLAEHGLKAELEEIAGTDDRVMVGVRTPGLGAFQGHPGEDQAYTVLTVRDRQIVAMRDCRDREEALAFAGLG